MEKILFSSVAGIFVFSHSYELEESFLFSTIDEYNKKDALGKTLEKKYPIRKAIVKDLPPLLAQLKKKEHYAAFKTINKEITRQQIKNSVNKDTLLIQAIDSLEELDKVINLLSKRLREWYGLYSPEIENRYYDHEQFVSIITKKSKSDILKELNVDETESMGSDLPEKDLAAIKKMVQELTSLFAYKRDLEMYLKELQQELCPNFVALAGSTIAAKLIAHAGSMKRLAEMPASTLQILGAEKALFRHLRNKQRNLPPKYGILHEHPLIQKAKHKDHGRVARALADKMSIAVRVDYFKGQFIGDKLKEEVMKKLKIDSW